MGNYAFLYNWEPKALVLYHFRGYKKKNILPNCISYDIGIYKVTFDRKPGLVPIIIQYLLFAPVYFL